MTTWYHTVNNLMLSNLVKDDYRQDAGIGRNSETHGGEDVAVFAQGPMAHLFMGTSNYTHR